MNNKNTAMIVTVVTALLCGCCSLFMCIMGIGTVTGNGTFTLGSGGDQPMPPAAGYAFLCLSIIAIIIPIVVGFFMLRKKPEASVTPSNNEPLPPAS